MNNKHFNRILYLLVIAQFFITVFPLSAFAGDEQNPEITDDENDMFTHPYFYVPDRSLKAIDVLSAWFYEDQNESNYLFITIKVVDLNYLFLSRSTYSVEWGHDVYVYTTRLTTRFLGLYSVAVLQRSYPNKIHFIRSSFDKEHDLVTFKIPKNLIDNPHPGDVLTRTRAGSSITITYGYFLDFYIAHDVAPNFQPSGKNYIIQY